MTIRDTYPAGVPCWVDTLTVDLEAARRFYTGIFGWELVGPGEMPGDPAGRSTDPPGRYYVARVDGCDVAGLGSRPSEDTPAAWSTHVAVRSADEAADAAAAAGGTMLVAPLDAPPAGRLSVIADPTGAVLCLWEAGVRQGARLVNAPSAWAMSMLSTPDPEGAIAFYGRLFGWEAQPFGDGVWLWRRPGYVGGEPEQPVPRDVVAAMARAEPGTPPSWSVDFWIADAQAAAEAAPGLGGTVLAAPHMESLFLRAVLAAPDGAAFSVSELRLPGHSG